MEQPSNPEPADPRPQAADDIDLDGRHFWPALGILLAVGAVVYAITLTAIFGEHTASFARIEEFPYLKRPLGRPKSVPTREELGLSPEIDSPAAQVSVQELFAVGLTNYKSGQYEAVRGIAGEIAATRSPGLISAAIAPYENSQVPEERLFAMYVAARYFEILGRPTNSVLVNTTPAGLADNMISAVKPGPILEISVACMAEVFRDEIMPALVAAAWKPTQATPSVQKGIFRHRNGRRDFFAAAPAGREGDAASILISHIKQEDADWIRERLAQSRGPALEALAGLAGELEQQSGVFAEELDGPLKALLLERLRPGTESPKSAIMAMASIRRDWVVPALLDRLAIAQGMDELPMLNMALVRQLLPEDADRLSLIVKNTASATPARAYAAIMLYNLAQRTQKPDLWRGVEPEGLAVLRAAATAGPPLLTQAAIAVLLLDGFEAGNRLLIEMLRDAKNPNLQLFLIQQLRNMPKFSGELKSLKDLPELHPSVRDALKQLGLG